MGAQAKGAPRIRSAMSVHAQVPVGSPRDGEASQPTTALAPEAARLQAKEIEAAVPERRGPAQEFTTVVHTVETAGEVARQVHTARPPETRTMSLQTLREVPTRRGTHDSLKPVPQPLLDEVYTVTPTPAISPAAQPAPALTVAAKNTQSEPTEVHVHIGRIEVIAAPELAAPKKNRATPARNTLPLADYLARRRPS